MGTVASQITSLTIVYSTVYSGAGQRKHQSSASLAFVRGIHRWPVNFLHKWPVTRKMFPFDDVIMKWLVSCFHTYNGFEMERVVIIWNFIQKIAFEIRSKSVCIIYQIRNSVSHNVVVYHKHTEMNMMIILQLETIICQCTSYGYPSVNKLARSAEIAHREWSRDNQQTASHKQCLLIIYRWYPAKRALPAMLTHGR